MMFRVSESVMETSFFSVVKVQETLKMMFRMPESIMETSFFSIVKTKDARKMMLRVENKAYKHHFKV